MISKIEYIESQLCSKIDELEIFPKYINIETEAQINTTAGVVIRTDVDINPYVFGVGIGRPF